MTRDQHSLEIRLAAAWDPSVWKDVTVLVAVSGGADSVALLCGLKAISQQHSGQLIGAHFNHQLRGAAADEDEQFVRDLCNRLDLPCEVGQASKAIATTGDGLEAEARRQRYEFLRQACHRHGARFVATAHTADDQAETILHRVVRGTGLAGLAGIPRCRRLSEMTTVIRPLLSVTRREVLDYLTIHNHVFRHDSSNDTTDFTRNRIRNDLLPMLAEQYNPQVSLSLIRLAALAGEAQQLIDALVEPLLVRVVVDETTTRLELECSELADQNAYLVRELFLRLWRRHDWPRQDMSESKWKQLEQLARSNAAAESACTLPGAIQVRRRGNRLILTRS